MNGERKEVQKVFDSMFDFYFVNPEVSSADIVHLSKIITANLTFLDFDKYKHKQNNQK